MCRCNKKHCRSIITRNCKLLWSILRKKKDNSGFKNSLQQNQQSSVVLKNAHSEKSPRKLTRNTCDGVRTCSSEQQITCALAENWHDSFLKSTFCLFYFLILFYFFISLFCLFCFCFPFVFILFSTFSFSFLSFSYILFLFIFFHFSFVFSNETKWKQPRSDMK